MSHDKVVPGRRHEVRDAGKPSGEVVFRRRLVFDEERAAVCGWQLHLASLA